MKLLTAELEKKLKKFPLYSQDGKGDDAVVIAKFFTPWKNFTWYVTEGEKQSDGDWIFFGLVVGLETEMGYFRLSDLEAIKGPYGLKIERDIHLSDNFKIGDIKK